MYVVIKTQQIWDSRSLNASVCFKRPEKTKVKLKPPGRRHCRLPFCAVQVFSCSDEAHIGEGHFISQCTEFHIASCRQTLTDTPRVVFDQSSGNPMVLSGWHIKLTIATPIWYPNFCDCKGVWQGYILSSYLFNLYAESTMWAIGLDES